MIGAILRKLCLVGLLVLEFRIAAEGHMLHQVSYFVNLWFFDEFIAGTKNNLDINYGRAGGIN